MRSFGKRIDGPGGRRFAAREPLLIAASVASLARSRSVAIMNVSSTGAQLRGTALPETGDDALIKVGLVERLVTIVWAADDLCGVTFDTPLTDMELEHLRREARWATLSRLTPEERLAAQDWLTGFAR